MPSVSGGVMAMPISMPLGTITAGALMSGGVFDLHIVMPPGFVQVGGPGLPPLDDLGPGDAIWPAINP